MCGHRKIPALSCVVPCCGRVSAGAQDLRIAAGNWHDVYRALCEQHWCAWMMQCILMPSEWLLRCGYYAAVHERFSMLVPAWVA